MPITAKKQTKLKEHEIKTGTKKKSEKQNSTEQRKTKFLSVRNIKISEVFKGPILTAIGNKVTLFVTRWLQALTISYLIDSFEIIMMPKEMFFGTIMANKFKSSFNFRIKKKGDQQSVIKLCYSSPDGCKR